MFWRSPSFSTWGWVYVDTQIHISVPIIPRMTVRSLKKKFTGDSTKVQRLMWMPCAFEPHTNFTVGFKDFLLLCSASLSLYAIHFPLIPFLYRLDIASSAGLIGYDLQYEGCHLPQDIQCLLPRHHLNYGRHAVRRPRGSPLPTYRNTC